MEVCLKSGDTALGQIDAFMQHALRAKCYGRQFFHDNILKNHEKLACCINAAGQGAGTQAQHELFCGHVAFLQQGCIYAIHREREDFRV
jgi:hypothetical protein